jgi:hypothetical protein
LIKVIGIQKRFADRPWCLACFKGFIIIGWVSAPPIARVIKALPPNFFPAVTENQREEEEQRVAGGKPDLICSAVVVNQPQTTASASSPFRIPDAAIIPIKG